jgi:stage II sporulation protein D
MRRALRVFALLTALPCAVIAQPHPPATLRIGLWTLWHDKTVTISPAPEAPATLSLCDAKTCTPTALTRTMNVETHEGKLALPANHLADSIELTGAFSLSAHGESLTLHNPVYVSARNGELVFSVTLPVETYVERVVASESGAADTLESLKALAIVVRSFALHQAHGHADYDLCDSTHCQLLHWAGSTRSPQAHTATLSTAGEALWFRGHRAAAWFHQNCGGRTASPAEVWDSKQQGRGLAHAMPWLISRADPYCTVNGARAWSSTLSVVDLTAALATAGLVRPGWNTLAVARRGESGRAVTLLVGNTTISAEDFRLAVGRAMGWSHILSTWFEVVRQGDAFVFNGRGSGHGVGLCQAGSAVMSAQGHTAAEILAQYFPGIDVADESTGLAWQPFHAQGFTLETLNAKDQAYLPELSQALAEAQSLSGLHPSAPMTMRAFPSTPAFRDATLAPGYVAAFTEGSFIGVQPLATLAARKLLASTLRHEFLHALVESQAGPATPLWLREGLVEAWSDQAAAHSAGTSPLTTAQTDSALAHASTEAESQTAHRAAALRAQALLDRYGRGQVLNWLRAGLPANLP